MAEELAKKITVNSQNSATPVAGAPVEEPDFSDIESEMQTRYSLLPEDIQDLIISQEYQIALFEVSRDNKLTYDELAALTLEVTMVLLGFVKEVDFRDELLTRFNKDETTTDSIVKMVNEKIFTTVKISLDKVSNSVLEPADYIPESAATGIIKKEPVKIPVVSVPPTPTVSKTIPVQSIPATQPVAPAPALTSVEKSVLEKTGVILSDTPKAQVETTQKPEVLNRNDLLSQIENPAKTRPVNIVANKLNSATPVMAPTTTDYSLVKTIPVQSVKDPYREPLN